MHKIKKAIKCILYGVKAFTSEHQKDIPHGIHIKYIYICQLEDRQNGAQDDKTDWDKQFEGFQAN